MKYPWEPCFVTARTESYTYETRWGSAVKPSEVHALLKLQNPFHSLLVKLPGVWAGPMSPPARVSSCCFPAHPVHGAVAQAGFAAARLAWLKVSAAPVLSLAMPHHSCADTFSLTGMFVLQGPALVWGSWVPQIPGTTRQGESMAGCRSVLLLAGMISSLCRARKRCEDSSVCFSSE